MGRVRAIAGAMVVAALLVGCGDDSASNAQADLANDLQGNAKAIEGFCVSAEATTAVSAGFDLNSKVLKGSAIDPAEIQRVEDQMITAAGKAPERAWCMSDGLEAVVSLWKYAEPKPAEAEKQIGVIRDFETEHHFTKAEKLRPSAADTSNPSDY